MHTVGSDSGGVSYLFGLDRNVSSASWRRPLSRSRVQLTGEERKGTVNDQEAAPGSAGPRSSGELAAGSGDTTKPTPISLPEDVISTVFEKTGPIVESCHLQNSLRQFRYYLQKLQVSNLLQHFHVEDRRALMEGILAKILLKFGAAQATCRDDDDHTASQLFQAQNEKKSCFAESTHLC